MTNFSKTFGEAGKYNNKLNPTEIMLGELKEYSYIVGGAVRDELMGITPTDIDYCVELNQDDFESFFSDLIKVGKSFPVYLINNCEVALTRTEKSTGSGYRDFDINIGVSIEDDLSRRDFTINSIAKCITTGKICDPHNGVQDIDNKIIRTINKNAFIEDPLRIIRGCRFAAKLDFKIDEFTANIMKTHANMIETIPKERIVLELEKVWKSCKKPSLFFSHLADIEALKYVIKPLDDLRYVTAGPKEHHFGHTAFEHTLEVIDRAKIRNSSFCVFIAAIFHDVGKGTTKPEILPHHYKHELRSYDITKEFLNNHKFNSHITKTVPEIVRLHMRVFYLEEMRDVKLVRLFIQIRNFFDDYVDLVNSDHPLNKIKLQKITNMKNLSNHRFSYDDACKMREVQNKKQFLENILLNFYQQMK